jgi:hypothetical protein
MTLYESKFLFDPETRSCFSSSATCASSHIAINPKCRIVDHGILATKRRSACRKVLPVSVKLNGNADIREISPPEQRS